MTAVWYVGSSDVRTISSSDWTAAGITGSPATVTWNKANGWSLPAGSFTAPQLALMAALPEFNTTAADGPRTGATGTQLYVLPTDLQVQSQRIRRDADRRAKLPLTTEPTSVTQVSGYDATLTKGYGVPVAGISAGVSTPLTAAQLANSPIDWGTPAFQKVGYQNGGGVTYVWTAASKDPAVNPVSGANALAPNEIRFMTNAPKVQILVWSITGAQTNGYSAFVNGQPCQVRPVINSLGIYYLTFIFPDAQTREISLRTAMGISNIYIAPNYDVWAPSPRTAPSLYSMGDSYSGISVYNDAGATTWMQEETLATGIEDHLGVGYHYIDAVGGTGWVARVASTYQSPNNNYNDRFPQVLRANPDVFFVPNGTANDAFALTDPNTTAANIYAALSSLRAQNQNTKIILGSGFTPPNGNYATNGTRYATLRAILQPMLQNIGVYYIDTAAWLYGTGRLGATTGNGNADFYVGADGVHLSGLGYRNFRNRLARLVARCMDDQGALINQVLS